MIKSREFYHPQLYEFKIHALKLNIANKKVSKLRPYLYDVLDQLDDDLFKDPNTQRISELARQSPGPGNSDGPLRSTPNLACRMTDLALELCKTKRERHPVIEEFFLINDSVTVAIEVPVWLTGEEAARLDLPRKTITGLY